MRLLTYFFRLLALLAFGFGLFAVRRASEAQDIGAWLEALQAYSIDQLSDPFVIGAAVAVVVSILAATRLEGRLPGAAPLVNPVNRPARHSAGGGGEYEPANQVLINPERPPPRDREDLRARLDQRLVGAQPDVVNFIDDLLVAAVRFAASDVHIQPLADRSRVTLRIQGRLDEVAVLEARHHEQIVRRLKVLSRLVSYQTSLPQDGAFSLETPLGTCEVRISTVPTHHGEKVALRLARSGASLQTLAELGLSQDLCRSFEEVLREPQGLIVLTGPTGSGKTTTIYSSLAYIHRTRGELTNMATIEDPIEIHLPFLNQTQVQQGKGLTFATGLRALLRQDPNVMMVGEIRDRETAEIAVQAGLTGHLVLTTLHADSSPGVFTRLIDTGVEPFLVASSVLACVSQRLVRCLCPDCREPAPVDRQQKKRLDQLGIQAESDDFWQSRGCRECDFTRVRERTAIFELLRVTPALRSEINSRVPTDRLREVARGEGMKSLLDSAVELAQAGQISLDEALRVAV